MAAKPGTGRLGKRQATARASVVDDELAQVLRLLQERFQVGIGDYKITTIRRRIERRMLLGHFTSMSAFADHLRANAGALGELHDDLFIHVTRFFRDPAAFQALRDCVFPSLLKGREDDHPIRIWVPGCSTGEEPYSLAMALTELMEEQGQQARIQIFATDISEVAIQQARRAVYPASIADELSPERLARFFDKVSDGYKLHKNVRDLCIVSRHDVTNNPPFAKLDLISCRNLLIYFGPELQRRVIPIFHYALKPSGFLWLGTSETPGAAADLFTAIDKQSKIYAKVDAPPHYLRLAANRLAPLELPRNLAQKPRGDVDIQRSADLVVLAKYGPPGVIVNRELDIVQYRGKTSPFLGQPPGQPTTSILKLVHPELLSSLRPLLQTAKKKNIAVRAEGLSLDDGNARARLALEVIPLNPSAPDRERQFLVLFQEAPAVRTNGAKARPPSRSRAAAKGADLNDPYIEQLQQEIEALREHQQTLIEEFEGAQEELTSANEELQATNEEFQSTNEELETAKEELQSANEELSTTNDELQNRNDELVAVNEKLARGEDRFRLMVESVKDYAIYMLDPQGHVTSWNEGARRLKGYEASEILGQNYARFFTSEDIAAKAPFTELERARVDGRVEAEGWRLRKDGTRFWANVVVTRINNSQGTLIGFAKVTRDLTERRRAEEELRLANEKLETRVRERTAELGHALKARDQFLSIASHELKTPLTGLKLQLQMARRGLAGENAKPLSVDSVVRAFDRALRQATVLEGLVEDFLDVSRIQSGRLDLELTDVNVAELVDDVVGRFADQMTEAKTPVELALKRDMSAHWDRGRMTQVLVNLISNALKYAPGSPIRISTARKNGLAMLTVADSGPGISAEAQATVFQRFERGGASPSVGGLGLGLFIARRIVEAHQGTIRLESKVGNGASFTIALPLRPKGTQLAADLTSEKHDD